jgi:hypothetical protein
MRIHTSLTYSDMWAMLVAAKQAGKITQDIDFTANSMYGSKSHLRAFEIQLGTYDKHSLPPGTKDPRGKAYRVRRFKNSGKSGAYSDGGGGPFGRCDESVYAATYDEWGWFLAYLFAADRLAKAGIYDGAADFQRKTDYKFRFEGESK